MIELVILVISLGGISNRATQRGLLGSWYVFVAGLGWVVFFAMGAGIGPVSLVLRWLWVAGVYGYLEVAHGGASIGESWQCPDCRLFNDSGTLVCLCGCRHPEAPDSIEP